MDIDSPEKWIHLPDNDAELLDMTRNLASEIRRIAALQTRLSLLKSSEELIIKIGEVLHDVEEQSSQIEQAMKGSSTIKSNLKSLCRTIQDVHEFFTVLNETKIMFFAKGKLDKRLVTLQQALRQKCTHLLASVSLELLKSPPIVSTPKVEHNELPSVEHKDLPKVEQKDLQTQCMLGHSFFYGVMRAKNYSEAFKCYIYAADRGHLDAMVAVGDMYCQGLGMAIQEDKGKAWYLRAHEIGSGTAKFRLAMMTITSVQTGKFNYISSSLKIPSNKQIMKEEMQEEMLREAVDLLKQASDLDCSDAQTTLGQISEKAGDFKTAANWYDKAIKNGSSEAENLLGVLYFHGRGVPRLREKAFELFSAAHNNGNLHGTNNIAMCLEYGIGVETNVDEALKFYRHGADKGSVNSKYSLGYLLVKCGLENSVGGAKDGREALMALGHVNSEEEEVAKERKLREGVSWLRSAMEGGVADAAYQLGKLYQQGLGLPYDLASAYSQYLWAARNGHAKGALCAANMIYECCIDSKGTFSKYLSEVLHHSISPNGNTEVSISSASKNLQFAATLYLQAAESGLGDAMNAYAIMQEDGSANLENTPDFDKAATWYYAAAEGGNLEAAGNLGILLSTHYEINEIVTIHDEYLSVAQIQTWLERISESAHIPSGNSFQNIIERLKVRSQNKISSDKRLAILSEPVPTDTSKYLQQEKFVQKKQTNLHSQPSQEIDHNIESKVLGSMPPGNLLDLVELKSTYQQKANGKNTTSQGQLVKTLPQLHRHEVAWAEEEKSRSVKEEQQLRRQYLSSTSDNNSQYNNSQRVANRYPSLGENTEIDENSASTRPSLGSSNIRERKVAYSLEG